MQADDKYSLGIDIGGTKANIGLFGSEGNLIFKYKHLMTKNENCFYNIKNISDFIRALLNERSIALEQIAFAGVGVPGTIDSFKNSVIYAPNLFWKNEPVGQYFKQTLDISINLIQDTKAAALGELLFGAGRDLSNIVCITLGTGIGSGIIINNKIYNGLDNASGELGHTIVAYNGRKCNCGKRGCLETYASGTAIVKQACKLLKTSGLTTEMVFEKALEGNDTAKKIIREAVNYLSIGVVNIINILAPEAVIISGGMCMQEDLIINPLKKQVKCLSYNSTVSISKFKLIKADLGEDAPLYGAGMLYKGI